MNLDVDAALRAWYSGGGPAAFSACSSDYIWWDDPSEPTDAEKTEALAALRKADQEADDKNRALMRQAIEAALGTVPSP